MIPALRRDVVDCFEQIDVAPERRERRGAEIRNARDVYGWSDFVVDRRVQAAVGVLNTRLVQRARAERGDVADLTTV